MAGFDNTSGNNFTVDIGDTENNAPPKYGGNYHNPAGSAPTYNEFQFVSGDHGQSNTNITMQFV